MVLQKKFKVIPIVDLQSKAKEEYSMKSKPRICVTCGTTYEYCPKCTKDADKPVWMVAFHTEECKK